MLKVVRLSVILGLCLALLPWGNAVSAQGGDGVGEPTPYENPEFGINMTIPSTWVVEASADQLIMGTAADVEAAKTYTPPAGMVITISLGDYNSMGVQNVAQLQGQMVRFAPSGIEVPPAQALTVGDASGYSIEFALPDSNIYTRVTLLAIVGARLAVVRAIAPRDYWIGTGSDLYLSILQTMVFTLPSSMANPLDNLPDNDGGVLWHYQSGQPEGAAEVRLGGITYDDFGVMYVAAGPRGILAINKVDGSFVNFLGPVQNSVLADVAIGPQDAQLYFANASTSDNGRIIVTDRVGNFVRSWGTAGDGEGQFAPNMPQSIAITRNNRIWVVSEGHNVEPRDRLYQFDQFGNLLTTINLVDVNPELRGIRLDNDLGTGGMYLVGTSGGLNILDSDGSLLVPNVAKDLITEAVPLDIAIGVNGLIVIATLNEGFLEFTNLGELVDRFGFPYDTARGGSYQPGEYLRPNGMIVDRDGVVYFAESNPETGFSQVQAFEFTGGGRLPLPGRTLPSDEGTTVTATAAGGQLAYGSTVRGTLDNRSFQHDYTFRAEAGDRLVITMRDISPRGELDTTLILLDGNGNEIGRNDDGSNLPPDSKPTDSIIRFTVGTAGNYIIRATRFGGNGQYELSLIVEGGPPTATPEPTVAPTATE